LFQSPSLEGVGPTLSLKYNIVNVEDSDGVTLIVGVIVGVGVGDSVTVGVGVKVGVSLIV